MRLFALLVLCLAALGARAEVAGEGDSPPRQLTGADEARAWNAVGRLDLASSGFCTGVLISDIHVLTAAHCLYSRATGQLYEPGRIVFKAGLRNGRALATRRARRFAVHDDYRFDDDDRISRVAADLAVIELEQPIRDGVVIPFAVAQGAARAERATIVSYAAGRDDAPALQEDCERLAMRGGVLVYSCNVTFGASGSPVFIASEAGPQIASVMSAMAQWNNRPVSLAAELGPAIGGLLARLEEQVPVARVLSAAPAETRPSIAVQLGRTPASAGRLPQIGR